MTSQVETLKGSVLSKSKAGDTVEWKKVIVFVGTTYALSWLFNLLLFAAGGLTHPASSVLLQTQMLVPAFCAIVLQRYFFKGSLLYHETYRERPRWFLTFFMGLTLFFVGMSILALVLPDGYLIASGISSLVLILGTLVLLAIRWRSGRAAFAQASLSGGKARDWLLGAVGLVLFYLVQTGLNYVFGLGSPIDNRAAAAQLGLESQAFLIAAFVQTVLVAPLLIALLVAFGEEYGWRGFLQSELIKLGKVKGVFLVGLIWAVWHAPAILMGHNYPGHPLLGNMVFVLYTVLMSFIFGYAVIKTGSIWLAAYLHAINNMTYQFLTATVYAPTDALYSFGAGIYGLPILALIVLLILRDPIWRKDK